MEEPIVVAVSGASGSIYGKRLVETLAGEALKIPVALVVSRAARAVVAHELGVDLQDAGSLAQLFPEEICARISWHEPEDLTAPFASGSHPFRALLVAPCSMNTLAAVAAGITLNLVHRIADVALKERRRIVLVPREAPLSATHLENLLALARKGVTVVPACPAFYHRPERIEDLVDFVVGRTLDQIGVEHDLYQRWGSGH